LINGAETLHVQPPSPLPSSLPLTPPSTGGTGYIGGSVLHAIATAHPDYSITVLLRRIPKTFASTYPNITIVHGDYDSTSLLASEAAKADIVVHNGDSDHEASLNALLSGLLTKPKPGYLLHLSGTGIVSDWRQTDQLGTKSDVIWSDVDSTSLAKIRTLPAGELHRNTETILHDIAHTHPDKINIAIMCPPDIYGRGLGLGKTHSALIPLFVHEIKALGAPFYYAAGTNTRSWVHISDLTRLYLHVVESAVSSPNPEKYFNANGYYFAATQEHSQVDLARATGAILHRHGVIETAEPVQVGLEQLDSMARVPRFPALGRYLFASNSRTRAERAEGEWGYKGEAEGLMEGLERDVLDALEG
tara:strand:- start:23381 stop:24463 length:1083 start_codon:yes stop_codon:yes gene_type:complete